MTKTDKMSSYGLYLQTIRVEKGIPIAQVAAETRIRRDILRAIEAEDHHHLPDDVFVKGFLKAFAQAIGADPEETLRRYALRRGAQQPIAVPAEETIARKGPSWLTFLWIGVVMAVMVGVTLTVSQLIYTGNGGETSGGSALPGQQAPGAEEVPSPVGSDAGQTPPAPPAVEEPLREVSDKPQAQGEDDVSHPSSTAAETPGGYVLEIVCEEDTWLKVIADDAPASEHFLKPGDALRLKADARFNLLIGNAAGVSVQLDGQPIPVPGGSGDVVNLELP